MNITPITSIPVKEARRTPIGYADRPWAPDRPLYADTDWLSPKAGYATLTNAIDAMQERTAGQGSAVIFTTNGRFHAASVVRGNNILDDDLGLSNRTYEWGELGERGPVLTFSGALALVDGPLVTRNTTAQ